MNLLNSYLPDDFKFLLEQVDNKPTTPPLPLISEYAENKRILPPTTPFPGLWENSLTPYLVEIMDNMSPFSPVQETVVIKAAQMGVTAAAENIIAYWMDENPTTILYISSTDELLKKWATQRLDPLIDSCQFREKIVSGTENTKSRRTGDKILIKEFYGGNLNMASAQSASGLRSDSRQVLIIDEVDGAPPLLRTGEGIWIRVAVERTRAYGAYKKIMKFSTPTTYEASLIYPDYLKGDQRKFLVPCPYCGKYQELKFGNEKTMYGLKAETRAGELIDVYYMCEFCHEGMKNHQKTEMLSKGRWEPTAKSSSNSLRSYHVSVLISPVGMASWRDVWEKFLIAQKEPDGMRSFVNLWLGLPFKESGSRPDVSKIISLRSGYSSGVVPMGVIYLVAGIDVQRGSQTDPENPPRLEMEVLGIGAGYRTWSVFYKVFTGIQKGEVFDGGIEDPEAGAWAEFTEFIKNGGMTFRRRDGAAFSVSIAFIDSGDGMYTDVVYRYTDNKTQMYPSKGFGVLKRQKKEKVDIPTEANFKRYRAKTIEKGSKRLLYEISTNYYKNLLYNNLNIQRNPIDPQRPGFCEFPQDYGEKYFNMLTAEEKRSDGSFHCPSGRRNEALDVRVMCLCAADVFLYQVVEGLRLVAKQQGCTEEQIMAIRSRDALEKLAARSGQTIGG